MSVQRFGAPIASGGSAQRIAVVVLGMHRSGTSAMSRMLNVLGCGLPQTLLPASPSNPDGHWESRAICDFNDEMLAAAGSAWNDWLPVNKGLPQSPIWPGLVDRARSVLRQEYGEQALFVIKDPRICRLGGFWREVLAAEGVKPAIVLPLRDPFEIALSLALRDGSDEHCNLLLWLRHVLEAEAATRGLSRVFTSFDELLDGWEVLAAKISAGLDVVWPRISPFVVEEMAVFLKHDMRHHKIAPRALNKKSSISPWISGAFEILSRWALAGEDDGDYSVLDAILAGFDAAAPLFAQPLLIGERSRRQLGDVKAERDALIGECDGLRADREVLAHERETLLTRLETLDQQLGALADSEELGHRLAVVESTLRQREEEITQLGGELEAACAAVAEQSGAAEQARRTAAGLAERLAEADSWVYSLAGERQAAEARQARLERKLAKAEAAAKTNGSEARWLREALTRVVAERPAEKSVPANVVVVSQSDEEEVTRLREEMARADVRSAQVADLARQEQSERFGELAALAALLRDSEAAEEAAADEAEWLRQVGVVVAGFPRWWSLLPTFWRLRYEQRRLKRYGLFDAEAYLAAYPDVGEAGIPALRHFLSHGMRERRNRPQ